jgi:uncharacterized membrane protein
MDRETPELHHPNNVERRYERLIRNLRDDERKVVERIGSKPIVARDINELQDERLTVGQRAADDLARFAGSWTFILTFLGLIAIWITINALRLFAGSFDPFPFILLNLILSLLAGLQAPVIMMSQNRVESRDRLRAENDYEINLKAELEIEQLHLKVDELRQRQWEDLLSVQAQQIALLEEQISILRELAKKS